MKQCDIFLFTPPVQTNDSNHLTTKSYYEELLSMMGFLTRPMEWPMQVHANENCTYWGQTMYGRYGDRAGYLQHLDGRGTRQAEDRR